MAGGSRTSRSSIHGRFEPGTKLGTRYRIVGLLGCGGMGEVYRADDLELGQSVALKFLPERVSADPVALDRFRNEVRTARQIAHPNVCRIYDIAEVDGHVFLSMEYVDGEDLAGVLRRLGRPSSEKAIEIARQICLGLAAAHENKVLHRDLKPANIMIDGRGRVRITDFGLAGFVEELERTEQHAGTPVYMAPEQLTQGKVSVRSDIYTLGLILHELFTGKRVFETTDLAELKRLHSSGTVSAPSSSTESMDPAVERVIARCLEHDPEKRPQSVYQVLGALPGGDPLAAALAAGETPSPELVRNASGAGGLKPRVAVGSLLLTIALFAGWRWLLLPPVVMPDRSPQELAFVATQAMQKLGYKDLPNRSVSGHDVNLQLAEKAASLAVSELKSLDWPPRYRYWKRWSTGDFSPIGFHDPDNYEIDGPADRCNETATIALDSKGRLRGLVVGADLIGTAMRQTENVDFAEFFTLADLDQTQAIEVAQSQQPPVHCDALTAWRFDDLRNLNGEPTTIQMGATGGRLTYFEVLGLDDAFRQAPSARGRLGTVASNLALLLILAFRLLIILLALKNLRDGRGDRRNAFRCALFVAGLYLAFEILSARGLLVIDSVTFGRVGGHVVIHGLLAWFAYMAIEPYVRRVWPRMLIGAVRLLSGRVRDPAVGREALIGTAAFYLLAVLASIVWSAGSLLRQESEGSLADDNLLLSTMSMSHFLGVHVHLLAWALLKTFLVLGILVVIRFVTRSTLAAILISIVIGGVIGSAPLWGTPSLAAWQIVLIGLLVSATIIALYIRVGVVGAFVAEFLLEVGTGAPLAGWHTSWFGNYAVASAAIPIAIAGFGFWVSLAGQSIFKDMLAESEPRR